MLRTSRSRLLPRPRRRSNPIFWNLKIETPLNSGFPGIRRCFFAGACPAGRRQTVPLWCPQGGLARLVAGRPCRCGVRRGRLGGFGRLPTLPLAYFPAPYSPDPLPGGKGETQSLFRRGLRPRHPCIKPFAALAIPAPGERTISNAAVACDG